MKLIECYQCGRWKFLVEGKPTWIKPSLEDILAVQLIEKSKLMTALTKGCEIYSIQCEDCSREQLN